MEAFPAFCGLTHCTCICDMTFFIHAVLLQWIACPSFTLAALVSLLPRFVWIRSFAMIVFQLFESESPFASMNPVDAARSAAQLQTRPAFPPRNKMHPIQEVSCCDHGACLARQCWCLRGWQAACGNAVTGIFTVGLFSRVHVAAAGIATPGSALLGWRGR
jgi:hypothetical protein